MASMMRGSRANSAPGMNLCRDASARMLLKPRSAVLCLYFCSSDCSWGGLRTYSKAIYLSIYLSLSLYIYIYRERETYTCIYLSISLYIYIHIYIYIYVCLSVYLSSAMLRYDPSARLSERSFLCQGGGSSIMIIIIIIIIIIITIIIVVEKE